MKTLVLLLAACGLCAAETVPTPESILGKRPGDDFYLASYDESLKYFQALAAASKRIKLVRVGKTSQGREWYIAVISSPENLAQLDKYKDISKRLAQVRGLNDEQAMALAREGKAIVHIDGGLHATECAGAQHTIPLAYKLLSESANPNVAAILDNVILELWFSINPDGQNMTVDWYRQNMGTPFEVSPEPFLYQDYVGHDNNRDGYMNNMLESQVVTRTTLEYNPQVFYNHHQSAPFPARIWIPPFAEPISSNVHPLMFRWVNLFGSSMAAYLEEHNMPGAMHRGRFDDWYPGFIDHVNSFRNTISFLTETALYRYATPHFYTLNDFPKEKQDLRSEVFYASPWRGGWWKIGDAVNYMMGSSMAVLQTASRNRESLLFNRYQAGRDIIKKFQAEPPFAYVIPAGQADTPEAANLARILLFDGLEIHQATQPFNANGMDYPAGSWVVLMDQPFAALAKDLLEAQRYPDLRQYPNGPPELPYDVTGWTLPMQMGVDVSAVLSPVPESLRAQLRRLEKVETPAPAAPAAGSIFSISHRTNGSFALLNEAMSAGATAAISPADGSFILSKVDAAKLSAWAAQQGVAAKVLSASPSEALSIKRPRVALYRPWLASIDEGWTRWILEQYSFRFVSLYNAGVRAGKLRDRFDAIVIPDIASDGVVNGFRSGTVPERYAGGIGDDGVDQLREFVTHGGTLIAFNDATLFAISKLELPVKNVLEGLKPEQFFCSGAVLRVQNRAPKHLAMMGMPEEPYVMFEGSPAFEAKAGFEGVVLASYAKDRNPLASGFVLHPERIQGKAAALDVKLGQGHVILLGFRPQWRGQSHGTYKTFFNALFLTPGMPVEGPAPEKPKEEKPKEEKPKEDKPAN